MVSSAGFVGDPLVDTQHFIGGSKFERTGEDSVTGYHQLRAAHQRYTGPDKKTVVSSHFPHFHKCLPRAVSGYEYPRRLEPSGAHFTQMLLSYSHLGS